MDYYGCENARQLMMLEPWRMNKTESPPRQRRRLRVGGLCTLIKGPISSSLPGHFLKLSEGTSGDSICFRCRCRSGSARETPVGVLQRIRAIIGKALGADLSRLMSASFGRVAVIMAEP